MTVFEESLGRIIGREVVIKKKTVNRLLSFLFKSISASVFNSYLKKKFATTNEQNQSIREWMDSDGYLLQHIKPYLFYCFKHQITTPKDCRKQANRFHVKHEDYVLVRYLSDKSLQARLEPLRKFKALSYQQLRSNVDAIPKLLSVYVKKWTYRKASFIISNPHYGVGLDDVVNHLTAKGIQNIYTTYPRIESKLHALNIAKRAVGNHGVNFLQYMTRDSRGIVRRDGDGFYSSVVPMTDKLQVTAEACNTNVFGYDHNTEMVRLRDSRLVCSRLVNQFSGKKLLVIRALLGYRIEEFTAWLQQHLNITVANDELYEDLLRRRSGSKTYIKYLSSWLKIEEDNIVSFGKKVAVTIHGDIKIAA